MSKKNETGKNAKENGVANNAKAETNANTSENSGEKEFKSGEIAEKLAETLSSAEQGIPHIVTEEDMVNNPELVKQDIKVNDTIYLPAEKTEQTNEAKNETVTEKTNGNLQTSENTEQKSQNETPAQDQKETPAVSQTENETSKEILTKKGLDEDGDLIQPKEPLVQPMKTPGGFNMAKFGKDIERILTQHQVGSIMHPMTEAQLKDYVKKSGGKGINVSFKYHDDSEENKRANVRHAKISLAAFGEIYTFPADEDAYLPVGKNFSKPDPMAGKGEEE